MGGARVFILGVGPVPLLGKTVGVALEEAVERTPDRTAVVFSSLKYRRTFQQLLEDVDATAAGLLALGVRPGDRVGVWGPNVPEWLLLQFATARVGAIQVNVNPSYRAHELEFALNKTRTGVLVLADSYHHQNYYSILGEVAPELVSARAGTGPLKAARLPHLRTLISMGAARKPGTMLFSELTALSTPQLRSQVRDLQPQLQFDDPINIQFTSGTTGTPKGATLTHHNIVNNAYFTGRRMGFHAAEHVLLSPLPFYHCFGMVLANLQTALFNTTLVVPAPSFHAEPTLAAIQQEKCTAIYGTPTMFVDLLSCVAKARAEGKPVDTSSLRTGIISGASVPEELMRQLFSHLQMGDARVAYGSTELSPLTTLSLGTDSVEERACSVGVPSEHVEVRVAHTQSRKTVPIGEAGELCVRGYNVMRGYWEEPAKTKDAIDEGGWYKTGDLAVMRKSGHVQIVGRSKDMIIRGGENIYPAEVEAFLFTHPNVKEAHIIGVPDHRLGEQVCAYIKLKDKSAGTTANDIINFCKDQITYYKIPKYVLFTDSFPLTVSGKVQKFKLREQAIHDLNLLKSS